MYFIKYKDHREYPDQMDYEYIYKYLNINSDIWNRTEVYIKLLNELNVLSSIIQARPDCNISHQSFYTLKNLAVSYLFIICTPYDIDSFEDEMKYHVYLRNVYPAESPNKSPIYELLFDIEGTKIPITTVDNKLLYYVDIYSAYYKDAVHNPDIKRLPNVDCSPESMSLADIEKRYSDFIDWCVRNEFFFMHFITDPYQRTELLEKKIFKGTRYATFIDPFSRRTKISYRVFEDYILYYDYKSDKIMINRVNASFISGGFMNAQKPWRDVKDLAAEIAERKEVRHYIVDYLGYENCPMFLRLAKSVSRILSYVKKTNVTYKQIEFK